MKRDHAAAAAAREAAWKAHKAAARKERDRVDAWVRPALPEGWGWIRRDRVQAFGALGWVAGRPDGLTLAASALWVEGSGWCHPSYDGGWHDSPEAAYTAGVAACAARPSEKYQEPRPAWEVAAEVREYQRRYGD